MHKLTRLTASFALAMLLAFQGVSAGFAPAIAAAEEQAKTGATALVEGEKGASAGADDSVAIAGDVSADQDADSSKTPPHG